VNRQKTMIGADVRQELTWRQQPQHCFEPSREGGIRSVEACAFRQNASLLTRLVHGAPLGTVTGTPRPRRTRQGMGLPHRCQRVHQCSPTRCPRTGCEALKASERRGPRAEASALEAVVFGGVEQRLAPKPKILCLCRRPRNTR
jgi:hypothetical protein